MRATISKILPGSIAEELGLQCGDVLLEMNGLPVRDVVDFMFHEASEELTLLVESNGEEILFEIEKDAEESLGVTFDDFLMDHQKCCKNKCIFCFIDQLPPGLRETLYFKDDDARLSFLMGNYITLTNLSKEDVDRIVEMHISPINISVHTTNPELRVKMMRNPHACKINDIMKRFCDAGIMMNCQIVLCKGVNDGAELEKSLRDLTSMYPYVQSVSVVPVGLTRYRDGLYPLESFDKEDALEVLSLVEGIARECRKKCGVGGCYASDEFYILAEKSMPDEELYDGYPQIENGVGLMRSLENELDEILASETDDGKERSVGVVTGILASEYMMNLLKKIQKKFLGVKFKVFTVKNNFFGEKITVSGLIVGRDIVDQLSGEELPERLLIPASMLRAEKDLFLDSMSLDQVSGLLNRPIDYVFNDGADLIDKVLGR